jgi:ParB/RepB/Spo0J family partition protein
VANDTAKVEARKRGTLRDLIGGAAAVGPSGGRAAANGAPLMLDLDLIDDNPFQPRVGMDEDRLAELAASIADHGLLQAITVRKVGERYQVIAGHRRKAAYRRLRDGAKGDEERRKYAAIASQEKLEVTDEQMALFALVENLQREDISPVEAAAGLARYQEAHQLSSGEVATRTGLDAQRVRRLLRLHRAPDAVKDGVTKGVMVPVLDEDGRAVETPQGRLKQEHRHLDLLAALEFGRLHAHWSKDNPKRAAERIDGLIRKALLDGWGFRKIQDHCRKAIAGPNEAGPAPSGSAEGRSEPLFACDERRLLVHLMRIASAGDDERTALRQAIDDVRARLG